MEEVAIMTERIKQSDEFSRQIEYEDHHKSILRRANSVGDGKKEVRFAEQLEKSIEINNKTITKRKPKRSISQPLMNFRPVETMKDFVKTLVHGTDKAERSNESTSQRERGTYRNLLFSEVDTEEVFSSEAYVASRHEGKCRRKLNRSRSFQERQHLNERHASDDNASRRRVLSDSDVPLNNNLSFIVTHPQVSKQSFFEKSNQSSVNQSIMTSPTALTSWDTSNVLLTSTSIENCSDNPLNSIKKMDILQNSPEEKSPSRSISDPGIPPSSDFMQNVHQSIRTTNSLTAIDKIEVKTKLQVEFKLPKSNHRKRRPPKLAQLYSTLSPVTSVSTEDEPIEETLKHHKIISPMLVDKSSTISTSTEKSKNEIIDPIEIRITHCSPEEKDTIPQFKDVKNADNCDETLIEVLHKLRKLLSEERTEESFNDRQSCLDSIEIDDEILYREEEALIEELQREPFDKVGLNESMMKSDNNEICGDSVDESIPQKDRCEVIKKDVCEKSIAFVEGRSKIIVSHAFWSAKFKEEFHSNPSSTDASIQSEITTTSFDLIQFKKAFEDSESTISVPSSFDTCDHIKWVSVYIWNESIGRYFCLNL